MIRWLVNHPTTVFVVAVAVLIFGMISYITLPRESSPDITIPIVLVTTPYIGVSPQDVEKLVTIPLENELAGLQDIKELGSTSAEGVSIISIEFDPSVNIDEALTNVRDRVSRAKADLPADVEESGISEINFSDIPIMLVNIAGPVDEEVLKRLGERLEDEVIRIPGVLEANLSGGQEREIQVNIDPVRLSHYGLSFSDVVSAIGNEDVNIPGGEVNSGTSTFLVRTPGDFEDPQELEAVPIKRVGDRPVFVRDVASVFDTFADRTSMARMNGVPSVSLSVTKRPGSNIIEIADTIKALVAVQSADWPQGVEYRVLSDESFYIRDQVASLQNNIMTALILVVGVIFFFMGGRNSLLVALAIPFSLFISMMVLDLLGFTLNMMVLFSLILALGMLVDNAIVVVENIYRHVEEGLPMREAAAKGASEVAVAVFASTMTTVAAFLPLVFWGGIMGEFMSFLPKTVIIVLLCSLFVSVFFLPMFSAVFMKRSGKAIVDESDDDAEVGRIMGAYRGLLRFTVSHRYLAAGAMVVMFFLSIGAYALLGAGMEFFPETEPDQATINVRAPDGTDVMTTDRIARRIEGILAAEENVLVFVTEVGVAGGGSNMTGTQAAPNQARISLDFLKDRNQARRGEQVRVESTQLTIARLREAVREIPGAAISVEKREMGPPVEKPIKVQVSGADVHEVGALAQRVRREIAQIEGTTELTDDYRVGRPELQLRVNRGAAKRVGVSTGEIGNTVRTAVAGATASTLRNGEDEFDIVVQLAPEFRGNVQSVLGLRIAGRLDTSPDSFPVPLSAIAQYELAGGTGSVRHVDQDLVVTITGEVLDGFSEYEIQQQVAALIPTLQEEGFRLDFVGSNAEQEESMAFLLRALAIALVLIILVLVAQFDSLTTPIIIIATVFLSMIGVLWGLIITQTPFGIIMTGIGVISLAGVVVNNAIVLLDYVGQLRKEGVQMEKALVRAGMTRFRPVMLTAATTILGLVPMAVGISWDFTRFRFLVGGASQQWWAPMAIAVIFGLAFATLMTLVMVPTLYTIMDDVNRLARRVWNGIFGGKQKIVATGEVLAKLFLVGALVSGGASTAQGVTLDQAFTAAEDNNVDLAIVGEQTEQARAVVGQAWSAMQPRLSGQMGLTINQFEIKFDPTEGIPPEVLPPGAAGEIVIQEKSQWAGNITLSQSLFNGEAIPKIRGAYDLRRAAEADELGAGQQIRAGVASSFYALATAREALELAEEAQTLADSQLVLATRRQEAGLEPIRSVIQAQLGASQARRDVDGSAEQLVRAEEGFHRLTGLERDSSLEMPSLEMGPTSLDNAATVAMSERLDLQAARLRVDVAQYQVNSKKWGWMPTVDANFTYVYQQAAGFVGQNVFWQAGVTGKWTLWDGGLRLAQTREANSQRRTAEFALRGAEQQVTEDLRVSWEAYERSQNNAELVEREVELATESLRLAEAGLSAGTATWLDVEQARILLRQTRLSDLQERMTRDLAAIELRRAMGTL
ncbi:MAG: multidrug efflux pump [Myxococcota bacterium]